MVERITTTGLQLELLTFVNFERLEALLGWNNSLIPASTYYSHNYSRIIGTGLLELYTELASKSVIRLEVSEREKDT